MARKYKKPPEGEALRHGLGALAFLQSHKGSLGRVGCVSPHGEPPPPTPGWLGSDP